MNLKTTTEAAADRVLSSGALFFLSSARLWRVGGGGETDRAN